MAKGGRKPKTAVQHKLQGTDDRKSRQRPNPDPGGQIPLDPPEGLNAVASEWWRKHAPIVNRMKLGKAADSGAFEEIAVMYARAKECDRIIEEQGLTYWHEKSDQPKKRPEVSESRMCWKEYRVGCEVFGLSPAGRARYGTAETAEDKDEVRLLGVA